MLKAKFIKKIVSIFLILNLIYANLNMAIFGLISYAIDSNKINYEYGKTTEINQLTNNPYLYCMNHGLTFYRGSYYCYYVGETRPELVYLVNKQKETQTTEKRDENLDPIANAIWALVGSSTHPGVNWQTVYNEALDIAQVTHKEGNVNIQGLNVITENEEGQYGPIIITYPTYKQSADKKDEPIGEIEIKVNGKKLDKEIKSGEPFYLTEEDNIKPGENNTIEVIYNGTLYKGTEVRFTPPHYLTGILKCEECGATGTGRAAEYLVNGIIEDSGGIQWIQTSGSHNVANCQGTFSIQNYYPESKILQDLIYIIPNIENFTEEKTHNFFAKENKIELSGKVWLDGQTGIKAVDAPNGKKDSGEQGVAGVVVYLKRTDGQPSKVDPVVTDVNGNYKFEKVPANKDYYIEFVYDGINYITTVAGDSDATEVDREAFNNKFNTITKNTAIGTNGTITTLEYTYNNGEAKLVTTKDGVVQNKYAMSARTASAKYSKNTENIDLGLTTKEVDLAAVTDLYSATVKINGESKTYGYNDLNLLEKDTNGDPILKNEEKEVNYNLYLYNSDYNYRIGDYDLPNAIRENYLTVNQKEEYGIALNSQRTTDGELSVDVTYQILLNNQSATDATINQIAYYYDARFVLKQAIDLIDTSADAQFAGQVIIDGKTYNKVIFNVNKSFDDSTNLRIGQVVLSMSGDNISINEPIKNWVEITSYSTNNSCIDRDSAPDNFGVNSQEDDTDDAGGINIQLNNIEREVSGYVFEDQKSSMPGQYNTGNGKYDNNESKIDDVIVQLIEIKNVTVGNTTLRLEYIWQETVSGSDKVRVLSNKGNEIINIKYTNDKNLNGQTITENGIEYTYKYIDKELKDGEYKFVDFIPGEYIVRFIYGDGTYYDSDSAENLLKYNGQDYKSTIDIGYNKNPYDEELYGQNSSARDSEVRRLEQMAYATSVTVDDKLQIDTQEKLNDTWMCADTSTILMKVSDAEKEGDTNSIIRNINFGLVERPRAHLVLEKHITGLKIDGITDATTTLNNYDSSNGKVDLSYNSGESVFATATSKKSIGYWLVETETDKIGGKRLEITYSYRIANIGDTDYIGEKLKQQLSDGKAEGKTVTEIYNQASQTVKEEMAKGNYTPGAYLGTAYYDGNITNNNYATSISFQIEDYMSTTEGLVLDDVTSNFTTASTNVDRDVWKYKNSSTSEKTAIFEKEKVDVIQSKDILKLYTDKQTYFNNPLKLTVYDESLDATGTNNSFTYRSYAAQLIYPTSGIITSETGTLCEGITLRNLEKVRSYVAESAVSVAELVPEDDEFVAETVIITMDTGEDKVTPMILVISITAGLAVIAVGIVLIKKFVIK